MFNQGRMKMNRTIKICGREVTVFKMELPDTTPKTGRGRRKSFERTLIETLKVGEATDVLTGKPKAIQNAAAHAQRVTGKKFATLPERAEQSWIQYILPVDDEREGILDDQGNARRRLYADDEPRSFDRMRGAAQFLERRGIGGIFFKHGQAAEKRIGMQFNFGAEQAQQ